MIEYDSNKHDRRSIRMPGYDYSSFGAYFVTICAHGGQCLFGEVVDGEMHLNAAGEVVRDCWEGLPRHYAGVELDAFVVMPNHVHAVVWIVDDVVAAGKGRGAAPASEEDEVKRAGLRNYLKRPI